MEFYAIAAEAGSLVLATLSHVSDNITAILAVTLLSWLITSAAASDRLSSTCISIALDLADDAGRRIRLLESQLEEIWHTIAEAPEDAVAYLKRAVVELTPAEVRDFTAGLASYRLEVSHLVHTIGFFVLFFRLAPGTDKERFRRSWSLATAAYLAAVDWFVVGVSWITAPEHPIIFFESVKSTILDALLDLATGIFKPALEDRLSAISLLILVACSLLIAAKIVLLAVQSLEASAGLPFGDREVVKVYANSAIVFSEQSTQAVGERRKTLRIITSPRFAHVPLKRRNGFPSMVPAAHFSPVRATSSRKLTPTKCEWTSEAWAPSYYSPIKFRRDLGKFRRANHQGAITSAQYRRTWKLNGFRPSPIDTRPELWQEVLNRCAPRAPSERQWSSDLDGCTEMPPKVHYSPVDPVQLSEAEKPRDNTFKEV